MIWRIIICLLAGYGFGCISTGYIVGKRQHVDIRKYGSGNVGTTNALRTLGKKAALITLLGDVIKCVIPVLLIKYVVFRELSYTELLGLYTALGVVLGHNFPFYLHFKGGKGIATMGGIILAIADWRVTLAAAAIFILIVAVTKYVSLGSLVAAWTLPVYTVLFFRDREGFFHMLALSLVVTALAYIRHHENIKRLLKGTERKLGMPKK